MYFFHVGTLDYTFENVFMNDTPPVGLMYSSILSLNDVRLVVIT